MNMNNGNINPPPGSYNPAVQSQSESDYWISQAYPGFSDPTQVPMRYGDTERPLHPPVPPVPPAQPPNTTPYQQSVPNLEDLNRIKQLLLSAMTPYGAAALSTPQPKINQSVSPGEAIAPIRIPLTFDLQFNISINLQINSKQNNDSQQ